MCTSQYCEFRTLCVKPEVLMIRQGRAGAITDVVCPGEPGLGTSWPGRERGDDDDDENAGSRKKRK